MSAETVKFNVGGQVYEVPRAFLSAHPNSLLSMLAEDADASDVGPIFVEADPDLFPYVLQFYEHGRIELPPSVPRQALLRELHKLGLEDFDDCIRNEAGSFAVALGLVQDVRQLISEAKQVHLAHVVAAEVMERAVTTAVRLGDVNFTVDLSLLREQDAWRVVDKHCVLIILKRRARALGLDVLIEDEGTFQFSRHPVVQPWARSASSELSEPDEAGPPLRVVGRPEASAAAAASDTVRIHVGARSFEVLREPTLSLHPRSTLRAQADAASSGEITVDADPNLFPYILQYLRHRRIFLPCNVPDLVVLEMARDFGLDLHSDHIQREPISRPMHTASEIASAHIDASKWLARQHKESYIGLVVIEVVMDALAQAPNSNFVVSERDLIWADPFACSWDLTPAAYERVEHWSRKNGLEVEIRRHTWRHFWRKLLPSGGYAWKGPWRSHVDGCGFHVDFRERPRGVLCSAWRIIFSFRVAA